MNKLSVVSTIKFYTSPKWAYKLQITDLMCSEV